MQPLLYSAIGRPAGAHHPCDLALLLPSDVEQRQTNLYGMLPAGKEQDDKWNGAVLAPKCVAPPCSRARVAAARYTRTSPI